MNLNHLKYFFDSARFSSISKSAEINFVGQSAVSKAIKALESDLNIALISHDRNSFLLTEDGEIIFEECTKVFNSIDQMKLKLDESRGIIQGELKIGFTNSMATEYLTVLIKELKKKYPLISIKLSLGRTQMVRNWVRTGECDMGIILTHDQLSDFDYKKISSGKFYLVKSPLYKGNWEKDGLFVTEETREVKILKQTYQNLYSGKLPVQMEIASWGIIKNFVLDKIGVGFLPDYAIKNNLKKNELVKVKPNKMSVSYETLLITQKGKFFNSKMKAFYSLLS